MVLFENKEHNDLISLAVKVKEIIASNEGARSSKLRVKTADSHDIRLSVWDASPAAQIDWQEDSWYYLQDALFKRWSSTIELNAANKTIVGRIEHFSSEYGQQKAEEPDEDSSVRSRDKTSIVHTTNSYLDRKNMGRRKRQEDYISVFEETINYARRTGSDAIVHSGNLFWSESPNQRVINRCKEVLERAADSDVEFYLLYGERDLKVRNILKRLEDDGLITRLTPRWNEIGDIAIFANDATVDHPESGFHYPSDDSASRIAIVYDDISTATGFTDIKEFESEIGWSLDAILLGSQDKCIETTKKGIKLLSPGPPERVIGKRNIEQESPDPRYIHRYDINSSGVDIEAYETSSRPVVGFKIELNPKQSLVDIEKALPVEELAGSAAIFEIVGSKDRQSPSKDEIQNLIEKYSVVARGYDERVTEAGSTVSNKQTGDHTKISINGLETEESSSEVQKEPHSNAPIPEHVERDGSPSPSRVAEAELNDIPGVGASREEMLRENCYSSVEDIANAKSTKLASDTELNEQIAEDIHRGAKFLQGHPDSVLAKLASDYDITEQGILQAYKRIVIYGGSFTEKKTALRMYFSDEQTIFNMQDISLHHLYLLYRNGFEDVESVAVSTTDALSEVPFITYQAEEVINKAREMANIEEESKEENKIDKTPENKETKSTDECICSDCGKEFKFERVYKKHRYSCDGTRTVTSESSGSKSPSTNDRSTSSKIEPCPLTEYYEAFRSLRATLKKLNPKIYNDDKIDPQTKYYKIIDSIITQAHPHNEEIEGYGSQQANRAPHKTDEYRDEFGNGEWITAYPAINSVGPEPACVDQFQSSLSEMELHISRPIPPGEETAIPIVIKSESELSEALWLLSQLPAKPALSPDEEHGSNSLPIEDIYEAKFEETNIETVGIQPPENKTVREAETNVEDDWEGEKIAAALGLNWAEIQNTITNLKSKGCSHSEAIPFYQQYLRELIRGEGLFALSGVGPIEALELREYGIKSVEDLQAVTADSVAANTELDTEEIRSYKSAAKEGLYDSIDPNFPDVAEQLLKDSVGHGEGVANEIDTDESDRTQAEATRELLVTQSQAEKLLQQCVGQNADFRPQQWQAIDSLVNEKEQLLLVQRTGWGKSTVYFIATHVLRKHGAGPTLIISPLLSLMRDQMKNAEKELGLSATTINSENKEDWDKIYNKIVKNEYDLVLISPERLENQEFREEVLSEMADGFGMFVVDEAHCISDWGHDFRPDYQRVTRILELLPSNVPVAATTATANDRVVNDITTQLPGLQPIRGNLVRESLQIQAINMGRRQRRLAWLAENLPDGQRAGIVYCLTTSDVTRVTEWLQKHGYDVESYHGSIDDETRRQREQLLLDNEVDALVATYALGMGFDKPDIKYVIHFQRPPNLIRYYQEIGRAGRDLNQAHAVVLSGPDDDDTAEYFIESAFPSANNFDATLAAITEAQNPLTKWDIRKKSNGSNVGRCLKILQVEGVIKRTDEGFVRTANEWEYPADKYEKITRQRYEELKCIQEFMETDRCLTLFIDEELDGKMTEPCGRCANCAGDLYPRTIENEALVEKAVKHFQKSGIETISNRVYRYADDGTRQKIPEEHQLETGRCLSVYDEPGWGTAVRRGKYETGKFNDSLVNGAAELIKERWDPSPKPEWVTFVPSTSEEGLIANFASRLADELDLEAIECVYKSEETKPQKGLSGSFEKCANVRNAFSATEAVRSDPVLLVDDIVSSRWTLTEVGLQLSQAGSEQVYPFALARRRG